MLIPLLAWLADRVPFGNALTGISREKLGQLMQKTGAPEWHSYAIASRKWRRHVTTACRWLNAALPKSAAIFEPGCGSGANLLWLAQHGFRRLYGSDIEGSALELGQDLAAELSLPLELWEDDSMAPVRMPRELDAILPVNWLCHIPGASFGAFLACYREVLKPGGYIACDMVTATMTGSRATNGTAGTANSHGSSGDRQNTPSGWTRRKWRASPCGTASPPCARPASP